MKSRAGVGLSRSLEVQVVSLWQNVVERFSGPWIADLPEELAICEVECLRTSCHVVGDRCESCLKRCRPRGPVRAQMRREPCLVA